MQVVWWLPGDAPSASPSPRTRSRSLLHCHFHICLGFLTSSCLFCLLLCFSSSSRLSFASAPVVYLLRHEQLRSTTPCYLVCIGFLDHLLLYISFFSFLFPLLALFPRAAFHLRHPLVPLLSVLLPSRPPRSLFLTLTPTFCFYFSSLSRLPGLSCHCRSTALPCAFAVEGIRHLFYALSFYFYFCPFCSGRGSLGPALAAGLAAR